MPDQKFIRPERVANAIRTLSEWRESAKSQAAMHLWPLLAIVRKKVGKAAFSVYEHGHEYDFWNDYFRLPGDTRADKDTEGAFTNDYYIDPLVLTLRPSDHPHRGPWTIRVRTFLQSWKAAQSEAENSRWKLATTFADIFVNKVLRRDDELHRVPVVDLAAFLFRDSAFPADADAKALEKKFRDEFPFETADYQKLFAFNAEKPETIFQDDKPTTEALNSEIMNVLVSSATTTPPPPPVIPAGVKSLVEDDDALFIRVKELLEANSSGIIFRGCPGTSKTWYAKQIAHKLVADTKHVYQCQFHPSLGYEDFVEGHVPDESTKSGFRVTDRIFLEACEAASKIETPVVVIIDEINRGDPARVFGELLTYIEHGYRGTPFRKAYSGKEAIIPKNLVVFGTMNQHDRSITQFDLALIRRFDHVNVEPNVELVEKFLTDTTKFAPEQIERVTKWFEALQKLLPFGIGHTYFKDVARPEALRVVWRHRMAPYCEAVLELDQSKLDDVKKSFEGMYAAVIGHGAEA